MCVSICIHVYILALYATGTESVCRSPESCNKHESEFAVNIVCVNDIF